MLVLIGQGPLVVVWIYDSCQFGAKVEVAWHCYWGLKSAWRGALGGFGVEQHVTLTPKTTVKFDPQPRQRKRRWYCLRALLKQETLCPNIYDYIILLPVFLHSLISSVWAKQVKIRPLQGSDSCTDRTQPSVRTLQSLRAYFCTYSGSLWAQTNRSSMNSNCGGQCWAV